MKKEDRTSTAYPIPKPKTKHFGIWSELHKKFMHNIDEPTKSKAWKAARKQLKNPTYNMKYGVKQHGGLR